LTRVEEEIGKRKDKNAIFATFVADRKFSEI
jgi:hypothetical protein